MDWDIDQLTLGLQLLEHYNKLLIAIINGVY